MSLKIIYPDSNGKAIMLIPNPLIPIEQVIAKDIPTGVYKIIEEDKLPDDTHMYFNSWMFDADAGVVIDPIKLKEIHLNKFRRARKPLLDALDVSFMKALESGDAQTISNIKQQKQALRDVTLTPINATSIDEITQIWPSILGPSPFN